MVHIPKYIFLYILCTLFGANDFFHVVKLRQKCLIFFSNLSITGTIRLVTCWILEIIFIKIWMYSYFIGIILYYIAAWKCLILGKTLLICTSEKLKSNFFLKLSLSHARLKYLFILILVFVIILTLILTLLTRCAMTRYWLWADRKFQNEL